VAISHPPSGTREYVCRAVHFVRRVEHRTSPTLPPPRATR
jgi:hypothetical protein